MAASQGLINKTYVSALDPFLDTREINPLITDIYNESSLTDIAGIEGRRKPIETGQPFYSTYVNDALFFLVDTTGGTVTGSGTATINFVATLATSGLVRKGDILLAPTGMKSLIVYNITTASSIDTIFVKSVTGDNVTLTAGQKLSVYSQAVGENSVTQSNLRFGVTRYFNKYQIFREQSKVTDVQKAATIETTINGQPYFIVKDHIEKKIKLKGDVNAAFIAGEMSATSFSDASPVLVDPVTSGTDGGGNIQTTRGLNAYNTLYGTSITNASLGTYAKADLDAAVAALIAARAPKDQLVFGGSVARATVDTYLKNLGSSGVTSVRLNVDGKELDLEVDKLSYGGFNFNYMTMPMYNHPVMFSQTDIVKSLYYIPYNKKVEVVGGGYDAAIGTRYIPSQTKYGNGMVDELHGGALAFNGSPTYDGNIMKAECAWTTKQGFEVLGASFLLRQKVNA